MKFFSLSPISTTSISTIIYIYSEIVTLKIESPRSRHPWMQFAGMFQNDPQFEDMLTDIQTYRQEIAEGNE